MLLTPTSKITRQSVEGLPMKKKPRSRIAEMENQKETLIQTALTAMQKKEDEFDAVGKVVAAKLRKMSDYQKIHAEKLVNDVLYMGLLDKLTDSTSISGSDNQNNYNYMSTTPRSSTSSTTGNYVNPYANAMQYSTNKTYTNLSEASPDYEVGNYIPQ